MERAQNAMDEANAARAVESDKLFDLEAAKLVSRTPEIATAIKMQLKALAGAEKRVYYASQQVIKAEREVDAAKIRYGLI